MAPGLPQGVFLRRRIDGERQFGAQTVRPVVENVAAQLVEQPELGKGRKEARIGHRTVRQGIEEFVRNEKRDVLRESREFHHKVTRRESVRGAPRTVDGAGAAAEPFAPHAQVFAVPPAVRLEVIGPMPCRAADIKLAAIRLRTHRVVNTEDPPPAFRREDLERRTLLHAGRVRGRGHQRLPIIPGGASVYP